MYIHVRSYGLIPRQFLSNWRKEYGLGKRLHEEMRLQVWERVLRCEVDSAGCEL